MKNKLVSRMLTDLEAEKVHDVSIKVLEKVGINVFDDDIRQQLIKKGAKPGDTNEKILFPKEMVMDAVQKSNRNITLDSVRGEKYSLTSQNRFYSSCLVDPFMLDYFDGKRTAVYNDCVNNSRLVDSLDIISAPYKMDVTFSDLPSDISVMMSNYAFMSNMSKHYICGPHNVAEARVWMEMTEIMAGGSLKSNKIISALVSPMSPLTFDKDYLDLIKFLAPYGIMLIVLPCPMSGATSPITLAGTVVIFNAEQLASITLLQTLFSDSTTLYHTCAHNLNMSTTQASLGGPEKIMLGVATADMGTFYNLPCGTAGSSTDAVGFGIQNGAESMGQLMTAVSGQATIVTGIGSLGSGNGTSAEQILFDCELVELAEHIRKGITVDDERLAFDAIKRVGSGGNFLTDEHTLKFLRSGEHFHKGSFERSSKDNGENKMYENLHEKAAQIINNHKATVPEQKIVDLQKYLEKAGIDVSKFQRN